jgi:hypothetical protein
MADSFLTGQTKDAGGCRFQASTIRQFSFFRGAPLLRVGSTGGSILVLLINITLEQLY